MAISTDTARHRPMTKELRDSAAATLAAAREEYAADARQGLGGRDAVQRYADRMDGLVRTVVEAASDRTATPFAVCAVGGYGRRAL